LTEIIKIATYTQTAEPTSLYHSDENSEYYP